MHSIRHLSYKRRLCISLIIILTISMLFCENKSSAKQKYDENEIKGAIENIYKYRSSAFVTHDVSRLWSFYDTSKNTGKWSLEHEIKRIRYLKNWAAARKIKFTNVDSWVNIKRIRNVNGKISVFLDETYKFDYVYDGDESEQVNSFGVGIRHTLKLMKRNENYIICTDWYTDCFEDALESNTGENEDIILNDDRDTFIKTNTTKWPYYNREKAVEYADKYCGSAWGGGNDHKYNKKYLDFTGIGGDCTNFASQVLGDKEGGSIPFDYTWRYNYSNYGRGEGTRAWVNADGLKDYLLYSGKGSLIAKGTYKGICGKNGSYYDGALGKIKPGDLVSYEKKGSIDHFAVVTGRDSHGYPLVNSHTTDRYRVPWDLGWGDKGIKFLLIHING